jgi:peptidoglycan/LPS O-acetylase OafA/YrhL
LSGGAITFITYLWHYLVARVIYDEVVRPLLRGDASGILLIGCVAVAGFLVGAWRERRSRTRAARRSATRRSA